MSLLLYRIKHPPPTPKPTSYKNKVRFVVTRGRRRGWELNEGDEKVQSFNYKIKKYWLIMSNRISIVNTAV